MAEAYIRNYVRTLIGRFGGSLSSVFTDDLDAAIFKALIARNASGVNDGTVAVELQQPKKSKVITPCVLRFDRVSSLRWSVFKSC